MTNNIFKRKYKHNEQTKKTKINKKTKKSNLIKFDQMYAAILLARIQSLSACWIRKSSTAFHRHPYFFSDQG